MLAAGGAVASRKAAGGATDGLNEGGFDAMLLDRGGYLLGPLAACVVIDGYVAAFLGEGLADGSAQASKGSEVTVSAYCQSESHMYCVLLPRTARDKHVPGLQSVRHRFQREVEG